MAALSCTEGPAAVSTHGVLHPLLISSSSRERSHPVSHHVSAGSWATSTSLGFTASSHLCEELVGTGCPWDTQGCCPPSVSLLPPALPWMRCRGSSTALARGAGAGERILTRRFGEGELSSAKCSPPGLREHRICGHSAALHMMKMSVPSQPKTLKIITKQSCACSQRCIRDDGLLNTRAKGQMNHITLHE